MLQVLGPSTGGIRRHVAALRAGLVARGWEVGVAGPAGVLDGLGGLDAVVPVPGGWSPVGAWDAWRGLRAAAVGYDLVHAHGLKAGWVATRRRREPLVLTVHNTVLPGQGGRAEPLLRLIERRLPHRADTVIATSTSLGDQLRGHVAPGRLHVVPPVGPAVEPDRPRSEVRVALGAVDGVPLVVGVGRLHAQKGWLDLVAAIAALRPSWPRLAVVVVGEGPAEQELRRSIDRSGLGDVMRLVGPSANTADELAAADVVVVPSHWESGPLVVAEAMALGRPVVATPVGFVPDLVIDGLTGCLVPVGDPDALAAAITLLLRDPEEAERLGFAGRQRVAEVLDPDLLLDAVEAVYRSTLAPS